MYSINTSVRNLSFFLSVSDGHLRYLRHPLTHGQLDYRGRLLDRNRPDYHLATPTTLLRPTRNRASIRHPTEKCSSPTWTDAVPRQLHHGLGFDHCGQRLLHSNARPATLSRRGNVFRVEHVIQTKDENSVHIFAEICSSFFARGSRVLGYCPGDVLLLG